MYYLPRNTACTMLYLAILVSCVASEGGNLGCEKIPKIPHHSPQDCSQYGRQERRRGKGPKEYQWVG